MREGFILHDNISARVDNRKKKAASCSTLNSHEEDTIKYCYQKCKQDESNILEKNSFVKIYHYNKKISQKIYRPSR